MSMYQSDYTTFMNDFLQKNPSVAEDQQRLRLTWWDKQVDVNEQRGFQEAKVQQKPTSTGRTGWLLRQMR